MTPWTYSPWNSPGQNTRVGSRSLLQGIFPTKGLNPGLPHCKRILYQTEPPQRSSINLHCFTIFLQCLQQRRKKWQYAHFPDSVTFVNWLELLECVTASCRVGFLALTCIRVICSHLENWEECKDKLGFPGVQTANGLSAMWETQVWSLSREDPLEEGMATHSRILAWRIPWTEEPGRLQPMGSHWIRHDWQTNTHTHTHTDKLQAGMTGHKRFTGYGEIILMLFLW